MPGADITTVLYNANRFEYQTDQKILWKKSPNKQSRYTVDRNVTCVQNRISASELQPGYVI